MKRIWTIAGLTFREGIRMRIVLVFLIVFVFIVLRLPFTLKGDETLAGRVQAFLSYALGALGLFASLATIFFSCATLTGELTTRSLHLVVTKPVHRFEILLGKWLGVNLLNLLVVGLSAAAIYGFAVYIRNQPAEFERDRVKLRDVVWTARVAANPTPPDFEKMAREHVEQLEKQGQTFSRGKEAAIRQYAKDLADQWLTIPPGHDRVFVFENLKPPEDRDVAYQVRFRARGTHLPADAKLHLGWVILDPETHVPLDTLETQERASEMHQFLLRAANVIKNGRIVLGVTNLDPRARATIYFDGRDSIQVLYKVGTFEGNYLKTIVLLLCRLAFLSALGVFFSTFVSFPVACFCVLFCYAMCIGMPWWLEAIGAQIEIPDPKIDPYGHFGPLVRGVLVPLMKLAFPNFATYSGVERLIDGIDISTATMLQAIAHTLGLGLLLLVLPGWLIFRSREVAEVIV